MNLNVFFDVLLAGTCLAPGYYLVRTLFQIHAYDELSLLKYELVPVLMAGLFFSLWVAESSYFDYAGEFGVDINVVRDATLFASVSLFAIATARFAETWGGYVKGVNAKKRLLARDRLREEMLEEAPPAQ